MGSADGWFRVFTHYKDGAIWDGSGIGGFPKGLHEVLLAGGSGWAFPISPIAGYISGVVLIPFPVSVGS